MLDIAFVDRKQCFSSRGPPSEDLEKAFMAFRSHVIVEPDLQPVDLWMLLTRRSVAVLQDHFIASPASWRGQVSVVSAAVSTTPRVGVIEIDSQERRAVLIGHAQSSRG